MFRHKGSNRNRQQNLKLAIYLSFVAGAVNMIGFYHLAILTTHVTGHFVFLGEAIAESNIHYALISILYLLCFLMGSFVSNFVLEIADAKNRPGLHVLPILLEIGLLILVLTSLWWRFPLTLQVMSLILAMGMQNALVTQISNAIVRTTHLTGLFTDLGIELSQLFFYKTRFERLRLQSSIQLRLFIILFFGAGALIGALLYQQWQLKAMMLPITTLLLSILIEKTNQWIKKKKAFNKK